MALAFSQSCENNKDPIIQVLLECFSRSQRVLEIGSGTGQHAVYFANKLPHLQWQTSDQTQYLPSLIARLDTEGGENLPPAVTLDVTMPWQLPQSDYDAAFTANSLHIMSHAMVEAFFVGIGKQLSTHAELCIYGPFNYQGQYTSDSNRRFDIWLKQQDERSEIKDFEWIEQLALNQGFQLVKDHEMPANNRLLHFSRIG